MLLETANPRLRSKCSGKTGHGATLSTLQKSHNSTGASGNRTNTDGESQPMERPKRNPMTRHNTPATSENAPTMSNGGAAGPSPGPLFAALRFR